MEWFKQIFIWWRGQTLSTRFYSFLRGRQVGRDEAGNIYYRHRQLDSRRWVAYKGVIDASKIPPEWHAWLHNMTRNVPRADDTEDARAWFKPHSANMTGTSDAYLREPSMDAGARTTGEYEAWQPTVEDEKK